MATLNLEWPLILDEWAIGIVVASVQTRALVYSNRAYRLFSGFTLQQLQGLSLVDLIAKPAQEQFVSQLDTVVQSGQASTFVAIMARSGKQPLIAKISLSVVGLPADGMVVVSLDTSRPQSTEENLLFQHAAAKDFCEIDIPTGMVTVSAGYAQLLGYNPNPSVETLATWHERLHPSDQAQALNTYTDFIAGVIDVFHVECRHRTAHGQWKWILAHGHIVQWQTNRQPKRLLVTHTDIDRQKRLEQQLQHERSLLKTLLVNLPALVWLKDPQGRYLLCNHRFEQLYGHQEAEILGRVDTDFVDEASAELFRHHDQLAMRERRKVVNEEWLTFHSDGHCELVETHKVPLTAPDGELIGVLGIAHDITARHQHEQQLSLAASVFSAALEGIMITDLNGDIVRVNDAFCRITGYARTEVLGKNARILNSGQESKTFQKRLWQSLLVLQTWSGEIVNRRRSGELFSMLLHITTVLDSHGKPCNYVAVFSDISAYKAQQRQLELVAHFDMLTKLPNRLLLEDRLQQLLQRARRSHRVVAVVFIDLDGFKAINDRFGHNHGDQVLVQLAQRLQQALRSMDTLARIGGDEFVAILPELQQEADCELVLERILQAAAQPIDIDGVVVQVSASVGVAFAHSLMKADADLLIRQADQAMYQAKSSGKNRYCVFDPALDDDPRRCFELLGAMQEALDNNQFTLVYQPQIELKTGQVTALEALIRWQHPTRGCLLPAEFMPTLAQHPLAVQVGDWVLRQAIQQLAIWRELGWTYCVSINIDGQQLNDLDFLRRLTDMLQQHPTVMPQQLAFEFKETAALENSTHLTPLIRALQELGVQCALDDFGTGYSSLTFLQRFPLQRIKLDQSLISGMLHDPEPLVIVDSMLQVARRFQRGVVAEGVLSELHGQLLIAMGCDVAQGFAIAMPMTVAQLCQWQAHYQVPASWRDAQQLPAEGIQLLIAIVEYLQRYRQQRLLLAFAGALELPQDDLSRLYGWLREQVPAAPTDADLLAAWICMQQLHQMQADLALQTERTDDQLVYLDAAAEQFANRMFALVWRRFSPEYA